MEGTTYLNNKRKIIVVCNTCGDQVELDLSQVRCKKCLDKHARELLRKKLGSGHIDPGQLKKALGIQ